VSTVRLLPMAAPAAAGVAIATGGVAIILSIIAVVVMLFLARMVLHRIRDAHDTESRTRP
jgi:nitrate reductase gamma subunit